MTRRCGFLAWPVWPTCQRKEGFWLCAQSNNPQAKLHSDASVNTLRGELHKHTGLRLKRCTKQMRERPRSASNLQILLGARRLAPSLKKCNAETAFSPLNLMLHSVWFNGYLRQKGHPFGFNMSLKRGSFRLCDAQKTAHPAQKDT